MSISDNYVPIKSLGNGVTTQFSGSWAVLAASYIRVYLESVATGVQTLQALTTDYALTFDESGFTVTFNTAPTSANYVVIGRAVEQDQSNPYKTSKGFQGAVIENSFDKLTAITQDLQDVVDRSLKFPLGSAITGGNIATPVDGQVLTWDDVNGDIQGVDLADLSVITADAQFSGLAAEDFLKYNGSAWTNRTPAQVRTDLGLVIGTNVQAFDAQLTDVAGLTPTAGVAIVGNGTNFTTAPFISSFKDRILNGLAVSTNSGDATNDIDIAAGACVSDDGTTLMTLTAITKQLDVAWAVGNAAGGLDTGTVGNNTYFIWVINRPDTNVTDVLFSLSSTAPTMPTNYTKKKRIGAVHRVSAANEAPFTVDKFASSLQTITAAGALAIPHFLGVKPFAVFLELVNASAEHGYSVGDIAELGPVDSSGSANGQGCSIQKNDATNINIRFGDAAATFILIHKTSGAVVSATNASWRARFRAIP